MKLTNNQIYSYASKLSNLDMSSIRMPVRINFFLQKNIQIIENAIQEIEQARIHIAQTFGTLNEDGTSYTVSPENMVEVNQELNDLSNLEQDLNIHIFKLDDFDGIELTYNQMSAIMFMIEE